MGILRKMPTGCHFMFLFNKFLQFDLQGVQTNLGLEAVEIPMGLVDESNRFNNQTKEDFIPKNLHGFMLANLNKTTIAPNKKCVFFGLYHQISSDISDPKVIWIKVHGHVRILPGNLLWEDQIPLLQKPMMHSAESLEWALLADHRVGDTKLCRKSAAWANAIWKLNHGLCKLIWCPRAQHHRWQNI